MVNRHQSRIILLRRRQAEFEALCCVMMMILGVCYQCVTSDARMPTASIGVSSARTQYALTKECVLHMPWVHIVHLSMC